MKTKYSMRFISKIVTVLGLMFLGNNVFGQGVDSGVQYPIAELGNCADKEACAVYCDKSKNAQACLNFAEKNNLMSKEEVNIAKNFIAAGSKGPGGCTSQETCEAYCDDVSKIDECVSFAEKNNLMPPAELAEAKKVQAAIAKGIKPPPCGNKKQCDAYCEAPDHMEECINFGAQAGFMQGKELEDAQKMLAAIKKGVKPPPCKGKEACDEYCSAPANMEVCINFAVEAGFMDEQEKADSQKMLQAVKKGINPPKCRGKEECDAYCGMEEHFEECLNFAEAAGFMSSEDAAMSRKTMGKGPGGCKGKEECEAFCNNPDNQETCFNFAKDNGLIPEEDLKRMEEGKQGMQNALLQAPPEVLDCLSASVGSDMMEKIKSGTAMPSREIGDAMGVCFEKVGPPAGGPGEGGMMQPGRTGPGGCTTPEECKTYCESHQEECQQQFQPGPGAINLGEQMMPPPAGPGGCKTPEECQAYCTNNPEECQNFAPGTQPQGQLPPLSPPGSQLPLPPDSYSAPAPSGPGGCSSPEECQSYCTNNPEACQNFTPPPPPPDAPPSSSDAQLPPPPDGQYTYPESGIQPLEGSAPTYDQPINYTPPPPTDYTQPPAYEQPLQPSPESPLPPISYRSIYLLVSNIPKIFSLLFY